MGMHEQKLLNNIFDAHGGLARWREFKTIHARIVSGGNLWALKGLKQDPIPRDMTVWLNEQRASIAPFGAADQFTDYRPDRIAILKRPDTVLLERRNPLESFSLHVEDTPWDPLHRAYFNGYALWCYLTMPFHFALPGLKFKLLSPWFESGEVWHQLRVLYPESIATHCRVQDFYFGPDHLLRRHDYQVDVNAGMLATQYVGDYIEASGFRLPSKRRAFRRSVIADWQQPELLVSIDFADVVFNRSEVSLTV